jgi:catalase
MTYHHSGAKPHYYPNSYGGPEPDPSKEPPTWWAEAGEMGRYEQEPHADDDDFAQARTLYRDVMDDIDREHLAANVVAHASDGVSRRIQDRVVHYWANVDAGLGGRVAAGLGATNGSRISR